MFISIFTLFFFFFNDTATTEIYTLSLHDALPIFAQIEDEFLVGVVKSQTDPDLVYSCRLASDGRSIQDRDRSGSRSEEHTSELQSHLNLVCRLLLEKKKNAILACHHAVRSTTSMS